MLGDHFAAVQASAGSADTGTGTGQETQQQTNASPKRVLFQGVSISDIEQGALQPVSSTQHESADQHLPR